MKYHAAPAIPERIVRQPVLLDAKERDERTVEILKQYLARETLRKVEEDHDGGRLDSH